MTTTKRWLDELPLDSSERELLVAGKSAQPPGGAIDADWQALCVLLGTTVAVSSVGTSSIAAKSVSAKVGSSMVVSKAASAGLLAVALKSLAAGVVVGMGVMGASAVLERSSLTARRSASAPSLAPSTRRPSAEPMPIRNVGQPGNAAVAPASSVPGVTRGLATQNEPFVASNPALTAAGGSVRVAAPPAETALLSQQARELAELKRLIDGGAAVLALRRLDANFGGHTVSLLSEERDALYVQALDRAQRRAEARTLARRFLARYPNSPYFQTMRQILAEE